MTDSVPSGREVIERVTTETGDWQLQRRDGHYEIICNGVFLMASFNRESSRALATIPLDRVQGDSLRVLVGGLGIGYTAGAVLADPRVRRLDLVEVEPLVVRWQREIFASLSDCPLDDPRTNLIVADLADVSLAPGTYDAILLDTDNFPGRIVRERNRLFYSVTGIAEFLEALRPGGALAFWAADTDRDLALRLRELAEEVEEVEVPEMITPTRRERAWIYVARSP